MISTRRLLRKPAVTTTLAWCVAQYIRLVWLTGRWRIESDDRFSSMARDGKPFILCFWHGRLLMMAKVWPYDAKMSVIISRHRDGLFISRAISFLGIGTISGSSSKGASGALLGVVRAIKRGEYVSITPDGPRGPRMKAAKGAAVAAKLSGAPLFPGSSGARRRKVAGSWDRFVIPYPFTRGIIRIGEPIYVPGDADEADIDRYTAQLEAEMIRLTHEIDADLGVDTVYPAPAADVAIPAGEGAE